MSSLGFEIPLTLFLLALLMVKRQVRPVASMWINALPEKVFGLIDFHDGKREDWGRTTTHASLEDATQNILRKTYVTRLTNGTERTFSALFTVRERLPNQRLVIDRMGLEGKPLANELLKQTFTLAPENGGTRLTIAYLWGPRPLLAQLMARADLWGGVYRLKGLAETGKPNERPYQWIMAAISVVTGALSLLAFALVSNFILAMLLISALLVHEFGHLLAYRLMGQPWGRLVFLPFLGAIAMPRLPFESQGQSVFAALMGPGFSAFLAVACAWPAIAGERYGALLVGLGMVTSLLNIFNLLPVEPLDGGVALRSVLTRVIGNKARFGLMAVGAVIAAIGLMLSQVVLTLFGGIAVLANLKQRKIDAGLAPITTLQLAISGFAYVAMAAAYITLLSHFTDLLLNLKTLPAAT